MLPLKANCLSWTTEETTQLLTNCVDDAAILVLGPIQRGQGRHSRLGHLMLEEIAKEAISRGGAAAQ